MVDQTTATVTFASAATASTATSAAPLETNPLAVSAPSNGADNTKTGDLSFVGKIGIGIGCAIA